MSTLSDQIAGLSPEKRAALEKILQKKLAEQPQSQLARIDPVARDAADYPLSSAEQRIWFLDRFSATDAAFNLHAALRLHGALDLDALAAAFQRLLDRHETLRTRYVKVAGEPRRVIDAVSGCELERIDLRRLAPEEREAELRRRLRAHSHQQFVLEHGNLIAAAVVILDEQEHALMLTMHHIVSDAWSLTLLLNGMWEGYAAVEQGQAAPKPLAVQYLDYAIWQQRELTTPRLARQVAYWRQQLAGAPDLIELATDHARPASQSFAGHELQFCLSLEVQSRVRQFARDNNASVFMVVMTPFVALLGRWSGQTDIVVGTDVANRNYAETEGLVGFFVNQLALRCRFSADTALAELLQLVRSVCLGAFANQDVPFNHLVDQLQVARDPSRSPVFQAKFMLQNTPNAGASDTALKATMIERTEDTSQFDLLLALKETSKGLRGSLRYRTELFEVATAERMLAHYLNLLDLLVAEPLRTIDRIGWLSPGEHALLAQINDTGVDHPYASLPDAFAEASALHADAIALSCAGQSVSYRELHARSELLAAQLLEHGVTPEQPVAVCMARSIDMVIALLAVLRSGACYVPLDPEYGAERLAYVLSDCAARIVLCDGSALELPEHMKRIELTNDWHNRLKPRIPAAWIRPQREQLAYIIYTSGSTGRPKGVAVRHGGLSNFLASMRVQTGLGADDRLLAVTTVAFDIAALELYLPLLCGASIVLATREEAQDGRRLHALVRASGITVMQATPSTWRALLSAAKADTLPLLALCGGEALPQELAVQLLAAGMRLLNVYGPTETTIWSSLGEVSAAQVRELANAPLGRPLANTTLHVLDRNGQPVPVGVPGELFIGGEGLARGYVNKPALTASAFVPDPFGSAPGARLYRTGDLVRWLADGRLAFLGRQDHQVKVRGYRIELGEIESVLASHPAIANAVVVTRADGPGSALLVAFLQGGNDNTAIDIDEVLTYAARFLPRYMLPNQVHCVELLPLTPNGKVDRKALAALASERVATPAETCGPLPGTELEQRIVAVWQEVLGVGNAHLDQDFFRSGGHSLLAVQLLDRIEREWRVELPLQEFFRNPTPAGVVESVQLQSAARGAANSPLHDVQIIANPDDESAPFPLTSIQQAYWLGRSGSFELGNIATQNYLEIDIRDFDADRFSNAWNLLVRRHGMLRAVFAEDGTQRILSATPEYVPLHYDLRGRADAEEFLLDLRQQMKSQVLPAARGPLFDLRYSRRDASQWRVHFCIDMLISDVLSNHILFAELNLLYRNPETSLRPLAISFRDYVLAEQSLMDSPRFERARQYWLDRVPSFPGRPDLPIARDPSRLTEQIFSRRRHSLSAPQWQRIKAHGQTLRVSPTVLVLTAFGEVLGTWSKEPKFALNLTLFNRLPLHADCDHLIGDFTSSLLLEIQHQPARAFADRAVALQSRLWQDLDHKLFSGVDMIRALARARGGVQGGAMPVVFTSILGLETPGQAAAEDAPRDAEEGYSASQTSQVWLDHQVAEQNGALTLVWDALDAVFPDGMLDEMFAEYVRRLAALADDAANWTRPASLLPAAQRARRAAINDVPAPLTEDSLHSLFERQAAATPAALAIAMGDRRIDYGTLARWSDALAAALIKAGAERGTLVAIVMHKGWEQIVAALAIIKAGAAYMPVDADLPEQRRAQVISEGRARIAVIETGSAFSHPGVHTIALDAAMLDALPADAPVAVVTPDDLAYVIFTSGSTGKPKGVVIDHRGAVNTILDINRRFDVHAGDSVLALSSLSFDLSVYDIFGLLAVGGSIVLPQLQHKDNPAHWWDCIASSGITIWNTVPALMQLLVDHCERLQPARLGPLRVVMMSGDWIPVTLPDRIRALSAGVSIYSLGGATEASIWSIFHPIDAATSHLRSIPYGRPLSNQSFHVLDEAMQPRPDHVTGPLYIGGIGLAKGYWSDPARTATSFVPGNDGAMLYRTGDLGRYLADGNIEFLGREDSQVKVQGYRIELGDIEAALQSHPAIAAAAVNAIGEHQQGKTLVAYVVARGSGNADDRGGQITDPQQRSLFKLEQRGRRRLDATLPRTALQAGPGARLLRGLAPVQHSDHPLPKYRYPSAASLYPVQVYLTIPASCEQSWQMASGIYYYASSENALVLVSSEMPLPHHDSDTPRLELIADLDAIEPLYSADEARRFCILEAGYVTAVIAEGAAELGLSLVPDWEVSTISHESLPARALRVGVITLQPGSADAVCRVVASAGAGAIKLPAAPAPIGDYDDLQRQSYRRYAARACSIDQISSVLTLLNTPGVRVLVSLRRCDTLSAGWYLYTAQQHALQPLNCEVDSRALFNSANAAVFDSAAFAVFIIGTETAAALAAIGMAGQGLMAHCWRSGVGVCPIGAVEQSLLREVIGDSDQQVLHAFVGGPIDQEQSARWEVDAGPHGELTPEALAQYLATRLPAYMVPRVYIGLAALPLSSNGKVDRKALPQPDFRHNDASAHVAPQTPTEQLLASLWSQLLKLERVGRHDGFFELGGNSLVAMQLASRLRIDHGIEIGLRQIFEHPTLAELSDVIAAAETPKSPGALIDVRALRREWLNQHPVAADHALFPLSMAQRHLFAHQQVDATATAYSIPAALRINAAIDPATLRAALQRIVDRHEALRTRFVYHQGEVWQRIDHHQTVAFSVTDLTALTADDGQGEAQRLIQADALCPFDLFEGPLLRARLLQLAAGHNVLMLNVHHIIADYLSMEILVDELNAAYLEDTRSWSPLSLQFADAVLWEHAFLQSEEAGRQRGFWQQHLAGVGRLEFPEPASGNDGWLGFRIDSALLERLRARCRELDITLFMLGFAAAHQLLAAHCGQNDFAIGTPISVRRVPELEPCIGLLLNTLPIRLAVETTRSGIDLLRETRTQCMLAFENRDYPYEELLTTLRRDQDRIPDGRDASPYRVRYVYRRIDAQTAARASEREIGIERRDAKFDLLFTFNESDEHAFGEFEYRGSALSAQTVALLCSQIVPLLNWLADQPEQHLEALHQQLAQMRDGFINARQQQRSSRLGDRLKQLRR